MLILFKHPNSTRIHRIPSKAKKGTSPIVPTNTPLLKITNQRTPICLAPTCANPTTAPTTPQNTRNLKNMSRATTIRPAPLLSKNQRPCQNAAKDQSFEKNESLKPRRLAPRKISPRIRPKTTPKRMLNTHLFENHTQVKPKCSACP